MIKNNIKIFLKVIITRNFIFYAIFGILTSILNIAVYQGLISFVDFKIANIIAIIITKVTSYLTSKFFVFKSKTGSFKSFIKEFFNFFVTRGFTMLIDYFGLIIAVDLFNFDKIISKYVLLIAVIILNYIFGKLYVFVKETPSNDC